LRGRRGHRLASPRDARLTENSAGKFRAPASSWREKTPLHLERHAMNDAAADLAFHHGGGDRLKKL
jgi:hypothetical protein